MAEAESGVGRKVDGGMRSGVQQIERWRRVVDNVLGGGGERYLRRGGGPLPLRPLLTMLQGPRS